MALAAALACCAAVTACGSSSSGGDTKVASGCKPRHQLKTKSGGVLTVTGDTLMPFSQITPKGVSGVEGELLKEIAAMECLKVKAVPVAPAAAVPSIQNRRADVGIGDWNRRADRLKLVDMSDPTFIDQMGIVSKDGIAAAEDLRGHSVGSITGYGWNDDVNKVIGGKLKLYPSNVQMYADLTSGRLDVAIDGYGPAVYSMRGKPFKVAVATPTKVVDASLNPPPQSAFLLPKSGALTADINADLAELKQSGKLVAILKKYGLPASVADTGAPRAIE